MSSLQQCCVSDSLLKVFGLCKWPHSISGKSWGRLSAQQPCWNATLAPLACNLEVWRLQTARYCKGSSSKVGCRLVEAYSRRISADGQTYRVCIKFLSCFYKTENDGDLIVRFWITLNGKRNSSRFVRAKLSCSFAEVRKKTSCIYSFFYALLARNLFSFWKLNNTYVVLWH